jgi:hypothetical protein
MNYGYNDAPVSGSFAKAGDSFVFYKSDFSISARAKIKSVLFGKITLDITEGSVSVGDIAENTSLSPKLTVENVTVDGGRARAFLIQTDNVLIKNCDIKNLGLAGIIISPDINRWFEMGPSENIEISGCSFQNVCAMDNNACKGAIFSASSHDGNETDKMIHKNIKIIGNTFSDIPVFSVNLTSVDGGEIKNNNYNDVVIPITTNCKNISID